jgi:hypothetical protein
MSRDIPFSATAIRTSPSTQPFQMSERYILVGLHCYRGLPHRGLARPQCIKHAYIPHEPLSCKMPSFLAPPQRVAWHDWEEWLSYFRCCHTLAATLQFAPLAANDLEALEIQWNIANTVTSAWRLRGRVPLIVDISSMLLSRDILRPILLSGLLLPTATATTMAAALPSPVHLAVCLLVSRLVSGIADTSQTRISAQSIASLAARRGVPRICVDIRAEVTHGDMPSPRLVVMATRAILQWTMDHYWVPQAQKIAALLELHVPGVTIVARVESPVFEGNTFNATTKLQAVLQSMPTEGLLDMWNKTMPHRTSTSIQGPAATPVVLLPEQAAATLILRAVACEHDAVRRGLWLHSFARQLALLITSSTGTQPSVVREPPGAWTAAFVATLSVYIPSFLPLMLRLLSHQQHALPPLPCPLCATIRMLLTATCHAVTASVTPPRMEAKHRTPAAVITNVQQVYSALCTSAPDAPIVSLPTLIGMVERVAVSAGSKRKRQPSVPAGMNLQMRAYMLRDLVALCTHVKTHTCTCKGDLGSTITSLFSLGAASRATVIATSPPPVSSLALGLDDFESILGVSMPGDKKPVVLGSHPPKPRWTFGR